MREPIRTLIVDGSAVARQALARILSADAAIEVVGVAAGPEFAWEKIRSCDPDVVTLDVTSRHAGGLEFLAHLMELHPLPVVVVSANDGTDVVPRARTLGAVDSVEKPNADVADGLAALAQVIVAKVKSAALRRVRRIPPPRPPRRPNGATQPVIAIGASTGGPAALRVVLKALPVDTPAILIVQHMPARFTEGFAVQLDRLCKIRVSHAEDGTPLRAGHAVVAPGDRHLELARDRDGFRVRVHDGPAVNRHRPSVDVLFRSVAQHAGADAVGVIMTGMGGDGAAGLLAIRTAGGRTLAQDEKSSVVFGMPNEAIKLGAVDRVVSLDRLALEIVTLIRGPRMTARVAESRGGT